MPALVTCPLCEKSDVYSRGQILHPVDAKVAGVSLNIADMQFELYACRQCGFQFKYPEIPSERLMACYQNSSGYYGNHEADGYSRRFDTMKSLIESRVTGRRVLDVGSWAGAFLNYLGDGWQRFGLEPSKRAAADAAQHGVTMLGATLSDLPAEMQKFDVISALDVAEHVSKPIGFFSSMAGLLAPGGVMLIETGDTDAWAWKLQGPLYWYCSLPEHVSFYSRKTMAHIAQTTGLEITDFVHTGHWRQTVRRRAVDVVRNLAYTGVRAVRGLGIPKVRHIVMSRGAPGWLSASDHLICLLRKPTE